MLMFTAYLDRGVLTFAFLLMFRACLLTFTINRVQGGNDHRLSVGWGGQHRSDF